MLLWDFCGWFELFYRNFHYFIALKGIILASPVDTLVTTAKTSEQTIFHMKHSVACILVGHFPFLKSQLSGEQGFSIINETEENLR